MSKTSLVAVGAAVALLVAVSPALANRCGDQNPPRCGVDTSTDPLAGCGDASMSAAPGYKRTGLCRPGDTMVVYDVSQPFPDDGLPADASAIGEKSYAIIHAGSASACAH